MQTSKRAAPPDRRNAAEGQHSCACIGKCNPCRCGTQAAQMIFDGFPPPPPALGMQEVPPMYSNDATTFAARYPSLKDLRAKADCMRYPK